MNLRALALCGLSCVLLLGACAGNERARQRAEQLEQITSSPEALRAAGHGVVVLHAYLEGTAISVKQIPATVQIARAGAKFDLRTIGSKRPNLFTPTEPMVITLPAGDYYLVGISYHGARGSTRDGVRAMLNEGQDAPVAFSVAAGEVINLGALIIDTHNVPSGSLLRKDKRRWSAVVAEDHALGARILAREKPALAGIMQKRVFDCTGCPAP